MLDLKVQTFLKVCETMNYTRAAEELNLTQPAVTKQIQALEHHYQTTLFLYKNRVLTLTPDGRYLRDIMLSMEQDLLQVRKNLIHTPERPRIHIGATLSIGNYALVQKIPDFIKAFPDLDVSLTIADTRILLEQLKQGNLDFIFCEGNFQKKDFEHRLIREVPLVLFYGADYPIGEVHTIPDLFKHTLLLREKGSGTREILETYLLAHGYSISDFANYHEINHSEVILKLLASNVGISILYENVGEAMVEQGVLKKLTIGNHDLVHEFNIIWNRSMLPDDQLAPYRDYLCDALKKSF